jgi:hypothetical protein
VFGNVQRIQPIDRTRKKQQQNPNRFAPCVEHEGEQGQNEVAEIGFLGDVVKRQVQREKNVKENETGKYHTVGAISSLNRVSGSKLTYFLFADVRYGLLCAEFDYLCPFR